MTYIAGKNKIKTVIWNLTIYHVHTYNTFSKSQRMNPHKLRPDFWMESDECEAGRR